jgi:hypothetical protein
MPSLVIVSSMSVRTSRIARAFSRGSWDRGFMPETSSRGEDDIGADFLGTGAHEGEAAEPALEA